MLFRSKEFGYLFIRLGNLVSKIPTLKNFIKNKYEINDAAVVRSCVVWVCVGLMVLIYAQYF